MCVLECERDYECLWAESNSLQNTKVTMGAKLKCNENVTFVLKKTTTKQSDKLHQ